MPGTPPRPAVRAVRTPPIGSSGLKHTGGFVFEDFLTQLQGLNGVKQYKEMADNDPIIGALLTAITLLLRGVEWRVEPPEDAPKDAAQEAVDFVKGAIFEDLDHPFSDFVAECLTFLPYGFALFETTFKVRLGPDQTDPGKRSKFDDGRIAPRRLASRSQDSIYRWVFDPETGDLLGAIQNIQFGDVIRPMVFIPIEKLLLFRTTVTKENPEGRSILRSAYVPYIRKQIVEGAEGRSAMRTAGIAELHIPSEYMSPDADDAYKAVYASYQALIASLSQDKQAGIVLPSDRDEKGNALFEFKYTTTQTTRTLDMGAIIERYDKRIATSALADFLLLGQQAVGSFALSSDKTALFAASLRAYNGMIADVLNRRLLDQVWQLNAFDPALKPKLVPGDVAQQSLDEIGTYITHLSQAGAPLFPDESLEEHLRDIAHLPAASGTAVSNNPAISGYDPSQDAGDTPVDDNPGATPPKVGKRDIFPRWTARGNGKTV